MDFPGNSIELHVIALLALIAVLFQGYSAKPFSVNHDGMVPVHAASRKGSLPQDSSMGPEYPRFKQGIWLVQITDGSGNKLGSKEEEFCGSLEYVNLFPHVAHKSKKQVLMGPEGGFFQRSRSLGSGKFLVEFKDNSFEGNSRLERHTVTADSGTAFTDAAVMLLDQGHKSKVFAEASWQRRCSQ
jgi:hypothetical protein